MIKFKKNRLFRILINTFSPLLFVIVLLVSNNCARKNDVIIKNPSETIRGNWKLIDKKNIDISGDTISTFLNYAECVLDDIYSFEENEVLLVIDNYLQCSLQQDSFEYRYIIRETPYNAHEYELSIFDGHGHDVVDDGISGNIIYYDENSFVIKRFYGCGDSTSPAFCIELIEFIK